jgi:hypothetical protein
MLIRLLQIEKDLESTKIFKARESVLSGRYHRVGTRLVDFESEIDTGNLSCLLLNFKCLLRKGGLTRLKLNVEGLVTEIKSVQKRLLNNCLALP